jgi:hypothetical protein
MPLGIGRLVAQVGGQASINHDQHLLVDGTERGISETSVNAVLAFIEAAEPKNEIEAALAIQMACTHAVAMAVLSRAGGAYGGDRHVAIMASAGARLLNAFTAQIETMRRLRNGGTQVIRIERVEVLDGGQAVIGNVKHGGSRQK